MNFTDEEIKSGIVVMYHGELDKQVVDDVREYNDLMCDYRLKMKYLRIIEHGYKLLNFLVVCIMIYGTALTMFRYPVLAVVILLAYAVLFVIFGMVKKNFRVCTGITLMLCVLDLRFLILTAADIILTIMQRKILNRVKNERGYPYFRDIKIEYRHRPRYDDDGNLLQTP